MRVVGLAASAIAFVGAVLWLVAGVVVALAGMRTFREG